MQSKILLLSLHLKEKELELRSIHQSKQLHNGVIKAPIELNMFQSTLPTIPIQFAPWKRCIFTLDDYSAHLVPEVEEVFFKKGILIIIGGGIKGLYRKHEMELTPKKLQKGPKKSSNRLEMKWWTCFRNLGMRLAQKWTMKMSLRQTWSHVVKTTFRGKCLWI